MKKANLIALTLTLAASLCSCGSSGTASADYFNADSSCFINETFYMCQGETLIWNPAWSALRSRLCGDPLCSHDDIDNLCPDNKWLWDKFIATDGTKIYLSALNASLTDANGSMYRQIFSLRSDCSDFRLLHTYEAGGRTYPVIRCSDGYLYFAQSVYREGADLSKTRDDQYQRILRLRASGGKPETVFDNIEVGTQFFVDSENYYLVGADDRLKIIVKKTGEVAENAFQDAKGVPLCVREYNEKTYLLTSDPERFSYTRDDGTRAESDFSREVLYAVESGNLVELASGNISFAENGIWCSVNRYEFLGTKPLPTGDSGETEDTDVFSVTTDRVFRLDPETNLLTEYKIGDGFSDDDQLDILSGADGKLLAEINNQKKLFENSGSGYKICLLDVSAGDISVIRSYD